MSGHIAFGSSAPTGRARIPLIPRANDGPPEEGPPQDGLAQYRFRDVKKTLSANKVPGDHLAFLRRTTDGRLWPSEEFPATLKMYNVFNDGDDLEAITDKKAREMGLLPNLNEARNSLMRLATIASRKCWSTRGAFRWPPQEENAPLLPEWPQQYQECYHVLLRSAVPAYRALLTAYDEAHSAARGHGADHSRAPHSPRPRGGAQVEQFAGVTSFSTSFINLFNYDHGFLGPHKDRCLLTLIRRLPNAGALHQAGPAGAVEAAGGTGQSGTAHPASSPPLSPLTPGSPTPDPKEATQKQLWVRHLRDPAHLSAPQQPPAWRSVDAAMLEERERERGSESGSQLIGGTGTEVGAGACGQGTGAGGSAGVGEAVVVFVGEEMEAATGGWVRAVEHAVCAHPERLAQLGGASGPGGWLSTALVLSSPAAEQILKDGANCGT